jgi:translation initiation factor IF-3
MNDEVRSPEVRLLDPDGGQLGVVSNQEAKRQALSFGLDLVEISPTADPPVCRIMDYGKFVYQEQKKSAVAKKKQKQVQLKELKFRPGTDEADLQVKFRKLKDFINEGDKVKITVRFRGREVAHQDLGLKLLGRVELFVAEFGVVEQSPKLEGRQMIMVIGPKKK